MTKINSDHRSKYECDDCYDEALMDIRVWDEDEPPLNMLDEFDKAYKKEYYYSHIKRNSPIKATK